MVIKYIIKKICRRNKVCWKISNITIEVDLVFDPTINIIVVFIIIVLENVIKSYYIINNKLLCALIFSKYYAQKYLNFH